jgi:cobalt/nickel transport system permease protein
MHMADALISPAVGGIAWAAGAGAVIYSTAKIKNELGDKKVPLMGIAGAFVFAAQMINFTIPATGSSGHIGGGILLAGLLGPYPALLAIAAVLLIQCLFFADGGLLALGCNILNMGIIPCLVVYPLVFKPLVKKGYTLARITAASILAVVIGLQFGAFGVVLETLASRITALPFRTFVLLMQPIHLAIGVVEGVVTAAVLGFVYSLSPEILESAKQGSATTIRNTAGQNAGQSTARASVKKVLVALALISLLVGGFLSIFASAYPDGLEWAMGKTLVSTGNEGMELEAEGPVFHRARSIQDAAAFMPDYNFPGSGEEGSPGGTSLAGILGSLITCALAGMAGYGIYRVKKSRLKAS